MKELALHILDLAENALRAGATELDIAIKRDQAADRLTITMTDNGCGMTADKLAQVCDPFYTTKQTRRTGLGIPLMAQAAERSGGSFSIDSQPDRGTSLTAVFQDSHIDRQPLGDLAGTITALLLANPELNLRLSCAWDGGEFIFDAAELREQLEGLPLNHIEILTVLRDTIKQNTVPLIA